jgi:hypothetical protein
MSYRLWQEKYGSDPSVIGSLFNLNDKPFTVRLDLKRAGVPSNHRAKGDREHRQVIAERTYGVVAGGLSIQNLHERGPVLCSARSASVCLLADSKTHLP